MFIFCRSERVRIHSSLITGVALLPFHILWEKRNEEIGRDRQTDRVSYSVPLREPSSARFQKALSTCCINILPFCSCLFFSTPCNFLKQFLLAKWQAREDKGTQNRWCCEKWLKAIEDEERDVLCFRNIAGQQHRHCSRLWRWEEFAFVPDGWVSPSCRMALALLMGENASYNCCNMSY